MPERSAIARSEVQLHLSLDHVVCIGQPASARLSALKLLPVTDNYQFKLNLNLNTVECTGVRTRT